MKKTFKNKIMGFAGVFLMTMMLVVAAGVYPNPFVSDNEADVAIVYGASAAGTDATAAESIVNSLANGINVPNTLDRILSDGVTDDEIVLGSNITSNKIKATLTDNKIASLFDGKIEWYDGTDTDSYNVHEEIIIGNLVLETTLDNNELEGTALTNNKALAYRYVFEEDIFTDTVDLDTVDLDTDDAEALEVTILGKEYLIEDVTGNSITVTDADEGIFKIGDTFTANGKTFTIDDIYKEAISVNGEFIKKGKKKTIDGIQIKVETIYYKDSLTLPSKVKLYYGGEISKEYFNGDAYIGEDEDDPEWVWSISKPGKAGGYIGVKYDLRQVDEDDDVVYAGEEYTFPNNFAMVSFDELTDVSYSDYEVFFDKVDLYYIVGTDDCEQIGDNDFNVLVIEGTEDDSFEIAGTIETDTIYLELDADDKIVNLYYKDVAEDYSNGKAILYSTDTLTFKKDSVDDVEVTYIDEGYTFETFGKSDGYTLYNGNIGELTEVTENVDSLTDEQLWLINDASGKTFYVDEGILMEKIVEGDDVAVADYYKASETITYAQIGEEDSVVDLVVDDTKMEISVSAEGDILLTYDVLINDVESSVVINLGIEDNEDDVNKIIDIVSEEDTRHIRSEDNNVMDYYGTIIESPESNMDDDRVVLKVPSEQVYAQISVSGSEEDSSVVVNETTPAELGIAKVTDGQVPADKNIIVVGGSCINTMAANLLGGKFCGAEFTAKTGVGAGQFLIQTFDRGDGKVVTLVAGYNAADTTKGVAHLLSNNLNIAVGEKVII